MISVKKWPSPNQWRQFFKVLNKKEKTVFLVSLFLALFSASFLGLRFYYQNTEIVPARGGTYVEGTVGQQPQFINPVYANSDIDRDLTELIFSGLMKYNEKGEIVPDLAEYYKIKEEGRVFEFYLKENLLWQDNFPLTADDVIFTVQTIQNSDYKSPLRAQWLGVQTEKISDLGVRFKIKNSYAPFLENATLKIIPKHIWQDVPPQNFSLSFYNLKPVGSGPYKIKEIKQDQLGYKKSLTLVDNPNYSGQKPNISKIIFYFFQDEKELIEAANQGDIKGLSLNSFKDLSKIKEVNKKWGTYYFPLPRYFALFFNPEKAKILAEKEIRKALNYGTNKSEIVQKLFGQQGRVVNSPILPELYGFEKPSATYDFDLKKAKEILDGAGFLINGESGLREKIIKKKPAFQFKSDLKSGSRGNEVKELQKCLAKDPEVYPEGEITGYFGPKTKKAVIKFQEKYSKEILEPWGFAKGTGLVSKMTRKKLNELCFPKTEETLPLSFTLTTVDQPVLTELADILKEEWKNLGVGLEIQTFDSSALSREVIKPRNYQILLVGQSLGAIADPFPFWHSSQKKDPGLNLAGYENKDVDKLLEQARISLDFQKRAQNLQEFQNILIEDAPSLFLNSLDCLYLVLKEIKGIKTGLIVDPSKRFSNIENWYIKTKRKWK